MVDNPPMRCVPAILTAILMVVLIPLAGCETAYTVETIEPFGVIAPVTDGRVYLEVHPRQRRSRGAAISVNDRAWTASAMVRRGDTVTIAYVGAPEAMVRHYDVLGLAASGFVRFRERTWYHDGFPAESRTVRVAAYDDVHPPAPPAPPPPEHHASFHDSDTLLRPRTPVRRR